MDKKDKEKTVTKKVKSIKPTGTKVIKSDVQGSYTGVPHNPFERPVQDADDL